MSKSRNESGFGHHLLLLVMVLLVLGGSFGAFKYVKNRQATVNKTSNLTASSTDTSDPVINEVNDQQSQDNTSSTESTNTSTTAPEVN